MEAGRSKRLSPEMIETIFALYHKSMLYTAYEYVKDKDRTEDIVQEVFERLAKYKLDIDNPYSVKTRCLMKVMVRNVALTCLDKENRMVTTPFLEENANRDEYVDPERLYLEKSDYQRIMDYIENMDPRVRDAMKLKYGLGMRTEEIAETLGVNLALTRYRIQRGRILLREALDKEQRDRDKVKLAEERFLQERRAAKDGQREKIIIQMPRIDREAKE